MFSVLHEVTVLLAVRLRLFINGVVINLYENQKNKKHNKKTAGAISGHDSNLCLRIMYGERWIQNSRVSHRASVILLSYNFV